MPLLTIKSLCKTCLDMIPQAKAPSGFRPPWLSKSIKKLMRTRQQKYNAAHCTNSPENWSAYHNLKEKFKNYVMLPIIAIRMHAITTGF